MLKPIQLYGEQKKVLFLPPKNPIQIKGVAGSGKTTVALYRAKHLINNFANLFEEPFVIIFSYNKSLVKYIKNLLPLVQGGYKDPDSEKGFINKIKNMVSTKEDIKPGLKVNVSTFHSWAFKFMSDHGLKMNGKTVNSSGQKQIIENIVMDAQKRIPNEPILKKKIQFFVEEFSWIKGKMLHENQIGYLEAKRIGRGTKDRVTSHDKEIVFSCFKSYQEYLNHKELYDFDDYALTVLTILDQNSLKNPFTHIVVDEAQDLTKAQILVLSRIVSDSTKSISFIADAAQRIFKTGFTWTEVGISVKGGRTVELKKNYRNTRQIAAAAGSLLKKETDKEDFTEVDSIERDGAVMPILGYFNSYESEMEYLVEEINKHSGKSLNMVILHRRKGQLKNLQTFLRKKQILSEIITDWDFNNFSDSTIKLCTLSSIKGLEFDVVCIVDLNENEIPYPEGFAEDNDELHISTERRLLYTAMTRARDKLYLLSHGIPSMFLNELDSSLFETVRRN